MQVGRWTHQSAGSHSGGNKPFQPRSPQRGGSPRHGKRFPGSFGPRRNESASRGGNRFPPRGGYGGGRGGGKRGGFGSFGQTEAEIAKFMNKTIVTTEEPVFVAEHSFSDFDINPHLKKNILARKYESPT